MATRGLDVRRTPRAPKTAAGRERVRRLERAGVLGAVLVLLSFGILNVLAVPPFSAGDETAHANYALELSEGDLPYFDDRYPHRIPGMSHQHPTMTAVHPPLYYLLVAPALRLGVATGHPIGGLWAARALTLLMAAAAVLLVARLAAALVPGRPKIAVAAAALLASMASFHQIGAFIYNDALAVLATAGTLVQVVLAIRYGADRRRTALLALWAVLSAATRASGLEVAALATLAAASPPAGERGLPWRSRLPRAVPRMALVGTAVALVTGWHYLRNWALYGDLTGTGRATRGATPGPGVFDNAFSPGFWLDQWGQLWGYVTAVNQVQGVAAVGAYLLLAAVLVGLARVVGQRAVIAGRAQQDSAEAEPSQHRRLALAWLAVGGHAALVSAIVLAYFAAGALPFSRYFFPLLPLLPVVMAVGLAALPGGRLGHTLVIGVLVAAGVSLAMTGVVLSGIVERAGLPVAPTLPGLLTGTLATAGVPAAGLVLAALAAVLAVGLALVAAAVVRLPR